MKQIILAVGTLFLLSIASCNKGSDTILKGTAWVNEKEFENIHTTENKDTYSDELSAYEKEMQEYEANLERGIQEFDAALEKEMAAYEEALEQGVEAY